MPYVKKDFQYLYPFKWIIPSICWATVVLLFGAPFWFGQVWLIIVFGFAIFFLIVSLAQMRRSISAYLQLRKSLDRYEATRARRMAQKEALETAQDRITMDSTTAPSMSALGTEDPVPDLFHVLMIANYKETEELLCKTLEALAAHATATKTHIVCLAMEAAETDQYIKAEKLIGMFKDKFRGMFYTVHEFQTGELRGKLSNIDWAMVHSREHLAEMGVPENKVLMTAMDADALIHEHYFDEINRMWEEMGQDTSRKIPRENCVFGAPGMFERNQLEVPFLTRIMDMVWAALAFQQQASMTGFAFPLSNFTVSLDLMARTNFLDTHEDAIADDSHVLIKSFYKTGGKARFRAVWAPINMVNLNEGNYFKTIWARFIQAKRHFRGQHDFSYICYQSLTTRWTWMHFIALFKGLETHLIACFGPLMMMGAIPFMQLLAWIKPSNVNWSYSGFFQPDTVVAFGASLLAVYITMMTAYELARRDCNRRLFMQPSPSLLIHVWEYIAIIPDTFIYVIIPHMLTSTLSLFPFLSQGGFHTSAKVVGPSVSVPHKLLQDSSATMSETQAPDSNPGSESAQVRVELTVDVPVASKALDTDQISNVSKDEDRDPNQVPPVLA